MKKFYVTCKSCVKKIDVIPKLVEMNKLWRAGFRCDFDGNGIYCPDCINRMFGGADELDFDYTEGSTTRRMFVDWWNNAIIKASKDWHSGRVTSMHKDMKTGKYIKC